MPLSNRSAGPYLYETYAPVKESLLFYDDNRCIYTYYDVLENKKIIDTCLWRFTKDKAIVLYKRSGIDSTLRHMEDSIEIAQMKFTYEICPNWYGIKKREFQKHAAYKSPIYQERSISLPLGISPEERARINRRLHPTFADKYGGHCIVYDTIINYGSFMLWFGRPIRASILFSNSKRFQDPGWINKIGEETFEYVTNSYEYVNYKINYEKKVDLKLDSIIGKQFSYIGESYKKESIWFVNDSICTHYLSTRESVSSPYVPQGVDTCRYSVMNNLIAIDFEKDKPCDTLTYGNGIIFYSKVYKEDEKYTHIVKPFIDETRSCTNKADSIDMIMSTYFNVYVPLNLYK